MQKKIIALAIAAAFAAPVSAMAAAELYGSIDAGYVSSDANGTKTTGMSSGVYSSNNWGFKGSDDLGDGMKATFQFENGFNTASGTASALFDRGIAVGISAGWGAVVLGGNQYTTAFKTNKSWDPLGYKFITTTGMGTFAAGTVVPAVGTVAAYTNGRNDNDVAYTGKFGDVTVMAATTLQTKTDGAAQTGDERSVGAVYQADGITLAASYTTKAFDKAVTTGADVAGTKTTNTSIGAAYKMGDLTVNAGLISSGNEVANSDSTDTTVIGASYAVSDKIGVAVAMYSTETGARADSDKLLIGATYALSKKTNLYAAYATNETQAAAGAAKVETKTMAAGLAVAF